MMSHGQVATLCFRSLFPEALWEGSFGFEGKPKEAISRGPCIHFESPPVRGLHTSLACQTWPEDRRRKMCSETWAHASALSLNRLGCSNRKDELAMVERWYLGPHALCSTVLLVFKFCWFRKMGPAFFEAKKHESSKTTDICRTSVPSLSHLAK